MKTKYMNVMYKFYLERVGRSKMYLFPASVQSRFERKHIAVN